LGGATGARLYSVLLALGDAFIAASAAGLAYLARFEGNVFEPFRSYMVPAILVIAVVVPIVFSVAGLYRYVWRQVGVEMILRLALVVAILSGVALAVDLWLAVFLGYNVVPIGVLFIAFTFLFLGSATMRAFSRFSIYMRTRTPLPGAKRVLIVGAGDAGSLLLRDIESQPSLGMMVVGLLDDDPGKHGRMLRSTRVLGEVARVSEFVTELSAAEVLIAAPSADQAAQARILDLCAAAGVPVRVMRGLAKSAPVVGVRDLRPVSITDLLGREPAPIDVESVKATVQGRVIAVTGAAGSIGSELCRQLLALEPSKVMLLDIDESRLYELFLELQEMAPGVCEMRICDIRDDRKLFEIIAGARPHMVLHAAAYKHVPLMEIEPDEAVKTNVAGTRNLIDACERAGVDRFVLISTDKAVAPKSVMGMTKAIAERIAMDACRRGLHATAVRFGNVLGSRGSVVPLFEEQLRRGGALKVTHPEVTRYFMTIPEAARLVLQAQALSEGGDIFVLEMGQPVRIVDLAEKMISLSGSDAHIEFTGLRPAEKLHEILTTNEEALLPTGAVKINRLSALAVPPPELELLVHELSKAARINDRGLLKAAIRRVLPDCEECDTDALEFIDEQESAERLSVLDPNMETLF
jgi:FlaA1/EpsC-like NDP-sugar epimerase